MRLGADPQAQVCILFKMIIYSVSHGTETRQALGLIALAMGSLTMFNEEVTGAMSLQIALLNYS